MILKVIFANSVDPDQTALLIRVHTVCLYAKIGLKSLQEYSADDINRRHLKKEFYGHVLQLAKAGFMVMCFRKPKFASNLEMD